MTAKPGLALWLMLLILCIPRAFSAEQDRLYPPMSDGDWLVRNTMSFYVGCTRYFPDIAGKYAGPYATWISKNRASYDKIKESAYFTKGLPEIERRYEFLAKGPPERRQIERQQCEHLLESALLSE